ncbi:MAG: hypothetical protein ACOH1N_10455 [Lutibacter sp.]
MENTTKVLVYNSFAFLLALIALFTSWLWTYYINLFTALPSIIGAYFLCKLANRLAPGNTFTKVIYAILIAALVEGFVTLFLFL